MNNRRGVPNGFILADAGVIIFYDIFFTELPLQNPLFEMKQLL